MNLAREKTLQLIRLYPATRKRRQRLPRMVPPDAIARDYAKALGALIRDVVSEMEPVLELLPSVIQQAQELRVDNNDDPTTKISRALEQARTRIRNRLTDKKVASIANGFAGRIASYQAGQMARLVKTATGTGAHIDQLKAEFMANAGIDILSRDTKLAAMAKAFVENNVSRMDDLAESTRAKISGAVLNGVQVGLRHEEIAKQIQKQARIGESRATLIARDQVLTLYGQVNAARQKAIGVTEFVWRTVGDQHVRDEHVELDSKRFKYTEPPDEGLPGEPILCRCYAEPVLDDLLDGL